MDPLDLRKKSVPPPAPAASVLAPRPAPAGRGNLPFAPGKRVLTKMEADELGKLGWKPGQPVPNVADHLAAALEEEQRGVLAEPPAGYDPATTPAFVPPKVQSIDSLSPAKRAELTAAIAQMQEQARQAAEAAANAPPPLIGADPSVVRAANMPVRMPAVVNDVRPRAAVTGAAAAARKPAAAPPLTEAEPTLTAPPTHEHATAGAAMPLKACPHCAWDLSLPDEVETTQEDRRAYQVAFMGGTRFRKSYELFDGEMSVTFRALTRKETDLVMGQIFLDGKHGRVQDGPQVFRRVMDYQLACALEAIRTRTNSVVMPEASDYTVDASAEDLGLGLIADAVFERAVPTDSVRRTLLRMLTEFDALVSKLEVESSRPGFTKATGAPR